MRTRHRTDATWSDSRVVAPADPALGDIELAGRLVREDLYLVGRASNESDYVLTAANQMPAG